MSVVASQESLRITRSVQADFPSGPAQSGSAFIAAATGVLVTCAHVVVNEAGENARRVRITRPTGECFEASVEVVNQRYDLARLSAPDDDIQPPMIQREMPQLGQKLIFAGKPQGVAQISVFPGLVSALGSGLLSRPRCELIQIAGMMNNGNSGGPLLDAENSAVLGVITAKYVPLLREIDRLSQILEEIPQFPSNVAIGDIDFSRFVNLTIGSMWQLATVLRLVQVGTGWSIPAQYFAQIGV